MRAQQFRRSLGERRAFQRRPHLLRELDIRKQQVGLLRELRQLAEHAVVVFAFERVIAGVVEIAEPTPGRIDEIDTDGGLRMFAAI